jgi:hypothetical protein
MPFEVFDKKLAAVRGQPYLSIQRKGIFALNHAAFAALGEPNAVELLFDREVKIIGLRPGNPASPIAYPVRPNAKGTSHLVSGTSFCKHYDIDTSTSRRWTARIEDGILYVDLNEPPVS